MFESSCKQVRHFKVPEISLYIIILRWMKEIRAIRFDHPYLITAYIYHMYLGLHTGAKILRQKFKLKGKTLELDAKLNVSIHALQNGNVGFLVMMVIWSKFRMETIIIGKRHPLLSILAEFLFWWTLKAHSNNSNSMWPIFYIHFICFLLKISNVTKTDSVD